MLMARWSARNVALFFASASVLAGCIFGGQTGEDSAQAEPGCGDTTVTAHELFRGMSPAEFAQAFAGRHTSTLRWTRPAAADAGAPVPDDEITITVTYQGADGTMTCSGEWRVPVIVDITTRDSGIHETGTTTLSTRPGPLQSAGFDFTGNQVEVSASLVGANGAVAISGTVRALVTGLPGVNADFPAP